MNVSIIIDDTEFEVEYTVCPGSRAGRFSPPEGPYVDIKSVYCEDLELTGKDVFRNIVDKIEDKIYNSLKKPSRSVRYYPFREAAT